MWYRFMKTTSILTRIKMKTTQYFGKNVFKEVIFVRGILFYYYFFVIFENSKTDFTNILTLFNPNQPIIS
jgi:hypothetical protein